jgi:hypothetical protein
MPVSAVMTITTRCQDSPPKDPERFQEFIRWPPKGISQQIETAHHEPE